MFYILKDMFFNIKDYLVIFYYLNSQVGITLISKGI